MCFLFHKHSKEERMGPNKNEKNFSQQPKKTQMPAKSASKKTKPEIDLPLKGGRVGESEQSSKGPSKKDSHSGPRA
jgi:hypothetical protein